MPIDIFLSVNRISDDKNIDKNSCSFWCTICHSCSLWYTVIVAFYHPLVIIFLYKCKDYKPKNKNKAQQQCYLQQKVHSEKIKTIMRAMILLMLKILHMNDPTIMKPNTMINQKYKYTPILDPISKPSESK